MTRIPSKTRRAMLKLAAATLAAPAFALAAGTASAAEFTLKLHQFLPAQANIPAIVLEDWADKVEEQSDGRIEVQHFPSMQLGGRAPELADQVIDGIADVIWTLPGYTPGRFPRSEAFELPFMMTNAADTSRAFWHYAEKNMFDTDFKDMKIIAAWVHGKGMIHSKEPILEVEDLNGVKIRAPSRVTNLMFTQLGATPIGMPVPAVPESLSKGVIQAAAIPWEVTGALKVGELVEHHTEFGDDALYTATMFLAMNKDVYESMPDDLKAVIDANSGPELSAFAGKTMATEDVVIRQAAIDRGNNVHELSAEQVADWKAAAEPVYQAWIDEMDAAGIDGAALVEEARALIAEHTK